MEKKLRVRMLDSNRIAVVLDCLEEDGEFYYIIKTLKTNNEKARKYHVHSSQIEFL